VHPMANLIATEQVHVGDLIQVDFDSERREMSFECADEGLPVFTMFRAAGVDIPDDIEMRTSDSLQRLSRTPALTGVRD